MKARTSRSSKGAGVTVQSSAYFGVRGRSKGGARRDVLSALHSFDKTSFGVEKVSVEDGPGDSIRIILVMLSHDLNEAERDADRAASAIVDLLNKSPKRDQLRERQRELVLS